MLVDCFLIHDEFELLNIRLRVLEEVVDRHVVVMSAETFTGRAKEPRLLEIDKYIPETMRDKVKVVFLEKLQGDTAWEKEAYSRERMLDEISQLDQDDHVIISDIDEIPRPDVLAALLERNENGITYLGLDNFNFKFNFKLIHGLDAVWAGPAFLKKRYAGSPQMIRKNRWVNVFAKTGFVDDAGWHFSFLTKTNDVSSKLSSFSHQEYDSIENREKSIKSLIENRQGFYTYARPGEVWAIVDKSSFGCSRLERALEGYPELLLPDIPDDPKNVFLAVRKSVNRMASMEKDKIIPWFSAADIARELINRAQRKLRT